MFTYCTNSYPPAMQAPPMPPALARRGPTLNTLHMVETVLRKADGPLSLNRIKELLPRKVVHATLREAIDHYKRLGCVTEGSKGVMWTLNADPPFWRAVQRVGTVVLALESSPRREDDRLFGHR